MGGAGGGGGATGRGNGIGGAMGLASKGSGIGGCGAGGGGAAAGKWAPQYPQNLLPAGNSFWQFGQMTWGTAGGPGTCSDDADGPTGVADVCWGAPQRPQAGAETGFIPPHDAQRI
jgi:hypothetical protein